MARFEKSLDEQNLYSHRTAAATKVKVVLVLLCFVRKVGNKYIELCVSQIKNISSGINTFAKALGLLTQSSANTSLTVWNSGLKT